MRVDRHWPSLPEYPGEDAALCLAQARKCGPTRIGKALASWGIFCAVVWLLGVD